MKTILLLSKTCGTAALPILFVSCMSHQHAMEVDGVGFGSEREYRKTMKKLSKEERVEVKQEDVSPAVWAMIEEGKKINR
ncbi:hypothetical protein Rhal01_03838 [Rubritalea halochordaticola]|uniref:Lipoprotein n=1 Tax=Rubritalea halochordaticola TaxID=714537 RepID=A0ABP9V8F4_9BACT